MLYFVRHGERTDQIIKQNETAQVPKNCDPHLTELGKKQSFNVGRQIYQNIIQREEYKPMIDNLIQTVY